MSVAVKVEECIKGIVEEMGYDILEVEYSKRFGGMQLTVYIDKPEGISLEDCEKVNKAIDGPLDELDPTDGAPYTLNVSSPGLDRPLKSEKDYIRNKGKEVEVSFYVAVDGVKKHKGIFTAWNSDSITIIEEGIEKTYIKKEISIIKPVI
jgi:ribosome maturation factor RimP